MAASTATLATMGAEGEAEGGREPLAGEAPTGPEGLARRSSNGDRPRAVPTMRDIAEAAGVSQSTVSRVLNDVPTRVPIAPETRERVTLAARKLGYRPNPL